MKTPADIHDEGIDARIPSIEARCDELEAENRRLIEKRDAALSKLDDLRAESRGLFLKIAATTARNRCLGVETPCTEQFSLLDDDCDDGGPWLTRETR